MKTVLRKDYPAVYAYVKSGVTYYRVDMRRKNHVGQKTKNFTVKDSALDFARNIGEKVHLQGVQSIATHSTDPRIEVWNQQLSKFGKSIEDALQIALKHFAGEKVKLETPYIGELLTLWVDDKCTNTLKPLRKDSEIAIKAMSKLFKKDFDMKRIAEINTATVDVRLGKGCVETKVVQVCRCNDVIQNRPKPFNEIRSK